ncbi:MAG: HDOD domain-containing protein [Rhodomicrobium sp.]|nr:HDOD domain-containing protein [Rhodomicrobium sp.]
MAARSIERARRDGIPLARAEAEEFGADQGRIGAYVLSLWGLPRNIVEAVAFHAWPSDSGDAVNLPLALVHAACALARDPAVKTWICPTCAAARSKNVSPPGGASPNRPRRGRVESRKLLFVDDARGSTSSCDEPSNVKAKDVVDSPHSHAQCIAPAALVAGR